MPTIYLSLGSNLGDRAANLRAALERLDSPRLRVTAVSRLYETEPVGETPEPVPAYLNCAARAETDRPPLAVLEYTQAVEKEGGRTPTFRWGPRAIDIDLLLYDEVTLELERLILPHPRLLDRRFVLQTLADIAPDLILPGGIRLTDRLNDPAIRSQRIELWENSNEQ